MPTTKRVKDIKRLDLIIVGGGLAGTAIAWLAHSRGLSLALINREDPESCSRVAAGLVTPITGSRAAASWQWDLFYPFADRFYPSVESRVGQRFWFPSPAVRIFNSHAERELFESRWKNSIATQSTPTPLEDSTEEARDSIPPTYRPSIGEWKMQPNKQFPFGAAEMSPAARLLTEVYLDVTKSYFSERGAYYGCSLDCDEDIHVAAEISIPKLGLCAERIVFCQGFEARTNHWFIDLPLHPARGDILDIQAEHVQYENVIHSDVWVVPVGKSHYRVGATYNRTTLDGEVDDRQAVHGAREELLSRLTKGISLGFESGPCSVVRQRAAVRPASYDRHPLLGSHAIHSNVFCFNGLGSKGSLMSPYLADRLLAHMEGATLDPRLNWRRREKKLR